MKYFGSEMLCPEDVTIVSAPVGVHCGHCRDPIGSSDSGFVIPTLGDLELPFHRACWIRRVVGSVAHQRRLCGCFVPGSTLDDDPALTRRQAAEAALNYFNRTQCDA